MKNLFLSIIIIMASFTACKKESNTTSPATGNTPNLEQLILNFEQKLESGQKDGTTYAIDSAVWYVEALLNYNLGSEGIECSGITVDTIETNLLIPSSGEYTLNQLETIYSELLDKIIENQPTNTIVFAADLYNYEVATVMVFEVQVAYATLSQPALKATADTSGYWYWGGNAGMCGPDSGLYIGMDATDILTDAFNPTWSTIWTSMETLYVNPVYPGFNYYDPNFPFTNYLELDSSRIFHATGEEEILFYCLTPAMMSYYASGNGIGYIIKDLTPEKKFYAHCTISSGVWDYFDVFHEGAFTYGIPLN